MSGAWIRVAANIADRKVVWRLAASAGLSEDASIGVLVKFWGKVSELCVNGDISEISDEQLEAWVRWKYEPGAFARFIREQHSSDGVVNEWDDYQGTLEDRKSKDRERKRQERLRRKSAGSPQDVGVTSGRNPHPTSTSTSTIEKNPPTPREQNSPPQLLEPPVPPDQPPPPRPRSRAAEVPDRGDPRGRKSDPLIEPVIPGIKAGWAVRLAIVWAREKGNPGRMQEFAEHMASVVQASVRLGKGEEGAVKAITAAIKDAKWRARERPQEIRFLTPKVVGENATYWVEHATRDIAREYNGIFEDEKQALTLTPRSA